MLHHHGIVLTGCHGDRYILAYLLKIHLKHSVHRTAHHVLASTHKHKTSPSTLQSPTFSSGNSILFDETIEMGDGLASREVLSGNEGHKSHHSNATIDQFSPRCEDEVAFSGCPPQNWHQGSNNPEQESSSNGSRVGFDLLKDVFVGGEFCCQCCNNPKHGQPAINDELSIYRLCLTSTTM